jgi:rhamnosyltransferase
MAEPLASVVIPTLNGGTRFRSCLEAVAAQELDGGSELIVIDSGSTDGTAELAQQYGRVIRIAPAEFNHGATRNQAIATSRGRAVALLVQDAVPLGRDWLARLVAAALAPGVAGSYARQTPRPDCPPFIKARLARWSAGRSEREVKGLSGEAELLALPFPERIARLAFDNVSSCVRRQAWERIPFRPRRFGEDVVWAKEALLAGYKIVYEPAAVVEHSHANSLGYEFKRVYLDHRNWREVAEGALFNNLVEVAQASWNGIFERWAELDDQGWRGAARLGWRLYALPYSVSQNLAQYLGSRSYKAALRFRWWRGIDEFMARGV